MGRQLRLSFMVAFPTGVLTETEQALFNVICAYDRYGQSAPALTKPADIEAAIRTCHSELGRSLYITEGLHRDDPRVVAARLRWSRYGERVGSSSKRIAPSTLQALKNEMGARARFAAEIIDGAVGAKGRGILEALPASNPAAVREALFKFFENRALRQAHTLPETLPIALIASSITYFFLTDRS